MGKLYVVATPIGNLGDMTYRAVEVLKEVGLIAAEDTRVTKKLLDHYGVDKPLMSYHEHNELVQVEKILEILKRQDVALVSDAGMPGISDPGYKLVRAAIDAGAQVIPLPGASALLAAVVASGLATDSFTFVGYLPKKSVGRKKALGDLADEFRTVVAYESPYRLKKMLPEMLEVMGDRQICVAREMTKKYEEFVRGRVSQVIDLIGEREIVGEVVVVIEGKREGEVWSEEEVRQQMKRLLEKGEGLAVVAKKVAKESGWKKKYVYELGLLLKIQE